MGSCVLKIGVAISMWQPAHVYQKLWLGLWLSKTAVCSPVSRCCSFSCKYWACGLSWIGRPFQLCLHASMLLADVTTLIPYAQNWKLYKIKFDAHLDHCLIFDEAVLMPCCPEINFHALLITCTAHLNNSSQCSADRTQTLQSPVQIETTSIERRP